MVIFSTLSWSAWAEEQVEVMESLEALELQGLSVAPLSSAPATVNRVPAEAIDQLGIQTARQALELIPGVGLASSDSARATSFSVRGSRETTFHEFSGGRSGVGFYLDDLPVMDAYGRDLLMFEVEEFRVLKGPNGTAVGVPHSMGVVDVVTRAPDSLARGNLSYRYGSYESHRLKAHLSGPIAETFFFGIDGFFESTEGWFTDLLTGDSYGERETFGGRFRFRWVPSDELEVDLTLGSSRHDDDPPVYVPVRGSWDQYLTYTSPQAYSTGGQDYQVLRATWKGEGWQMKSVSSHRNTEFDDNDPMFLQNVFDPGRLPRRRDLEMDVWSQEVRFESTVPDAAWRWRAGVFFSSRDSNLDNFMLGLGPWEGLNRLHYRFDDYALYGEVTHRINDCLELSGGIRFQTLRDHTRSSFVPTPFAESIGGTAISLDGKKSFSAVLPMFAATWDWSDRNQSYFRLSTGMQPGGLAIAAAGAGDYDSEKSIHYELGHDSTFADGRVNLHFAAFYTDYKDYQSFQFNPAGQTVFNADEAHALGLEGEFRWFPCEELGVYAAAGYTRARYDEFLAPTGNFSGNRINNIPAMTLNLGGEYRASWGGVARVDWRLVGDTYFDDGNSVRQSAYNTLALRIGYERGDMGVYLFGSNLFDTEYYTNAYLFLGRPAASPGRPRMVGVEVRAAF